MKTKVGVCYRPWLHNEFIEDLAPLVDAFEIMPDATGLTDLKRIKAVADANNLPLATHCLRSSLAQPDGYQHENTKNYFLCDRFLNSRYYSDHLAFSYYQDTYLSSVQAIAYTQNNLEITAGNITNLAQKFDGPVLIENIVQNGINPANEMTESQFFNELMQRTPDNVKLLFDLTNMFVTAHNTGIEFEDYIKKYPFDQVKSMHVSGFSTDDGLYYKDSHNTDIDKVQAKLLEAILNEVSLDFLFVERDFNVQNIDDVKRDLATLKTALSVQNIEIV